MASLWKNRLIGSYKVVSPVISLLRLVPWKWTPSPRVFFFGLASPENLSLNQEVGRGSKGPNFRYAHNTSLWNTSSFRRENLLRWACFRKWPSRNVLSVYSLCMINYNLTLCNGQNQQLSHIKCGKLYGIKGVRNEFNFPYIIAE